MQTSHHLGKQAETLLCPSRTNERIWRQSNLEFFFITAGTDTVGGWALLCNM